MNTTFANLKSLAESFLAIADELNEGVSAYLDGSNRKNDRECYYKVKEAYKTFIKEYNRYFEESHDDSLDYNLAESVIF